MVAFVQVVPVDLLSFVIHLFVEEFEKLFLNIEVHQVLSALQISQIWVELVP